MKFVFVLLLLGACWSARSMSPFSTYPAPLPAPRVAEEPTTMETCDVGELPVGYEMVDRLSCETEEGDVDWWCMYHQAMTREWRLGIWVERYTECAIDERERLQRYERIVRGRSIP